MFGMAENIYGSVDNMTMIEFLFHQSMIFTTNCFDGLEETYFYLISRVFWTVEKNNQCLGTVHGFSMLLIDMINFLCHLLCWGVKAWIVHMVKTMQYREKLKQSQKRNGGQGSITDIYNWIFTSLLQIFPGEVLFSYHPSFSLFLEIFCMRKVWIKSVNSFKMLNRIITERQK